jgi:hypothetical protein
MGSQAESGLVVTPAEMTLKGLVHEMLTNGPGHRGKGQGEKHGSCQHSGLCIWAGIMKRIVEKIDTYAGKCEEKRQAQVCPSSHTD